jgi:hypothetical protein
MADRGQKPEEEAKSPDMYSYWEKYIELKQKMKKYPMDTKDDKAGDFQTLFRYN